MAKQDVLWNFYKKGMITNEALAEINRINLDKDLRKKKIETGPIASCKNEQMAVYATLQIVESLFAKIDELFYGTYKGNVTASQTTNQYVINVQKQMSTIMQGLKTSETNLRNAVSQSSVNTAKLLKQETLRINKIISMMEKSGANKGLVDNFRSDLKKATKVIREGSTSDLKELEQTIIRTLHKRDEAFVKAVGEQYKELVSEINKQKKSEAKGAKPDLAPEMKEQLTGISDNLDLVGDKIEALQGSILEFMETSVTSGGDGGGDMGKVLEALEDNAQENAELNEAQTQMLIEQTAVMQSEMESYQRSSEKKLEIFQARIEKYQKVSKDELSTELKDLRGLVNSMRADIELMKTIVSKLGK